MNCPCHADTRRLLGDESGLREFERLHEIRVHSTTGQFYDDIGQGRSMPSGIRRGFESLENIKGLLAKRDWMVETKEGFPGRG